MSDAAYVVQKVEWYQFRAQDGTAFFVMVSTLPNGFVTAVPCDLTMVRAEHHLMALAPNLAWRLRDDGTRNHAESAACSDAGSSV